MIKHTVASYLVKRSDEMFLRVSDLQAADSEPSTGNPAVVWDEVSGAPVADGETEQPALSGVTEVNGIPVDTVFDLLKQRVAPYTLDVVSRETGIDKETIIEIAMAFVDGPCTMWQGYGLDRYDDSHMIGHAQATLACITGNMGIQGGSFGYPNVAQGMMMASLGWWNSIDSNHNLTTVPWLCLPEVLETGKFMGEDYPIKAMLIMSGNPISNHSQQKDVIEKLLPKIDFIVTHELRMTDSARYSDIVLPSAHYFEAWDYCGSAFVHLNEKAIDPLYEAKSNVDFISELAAAMGLGEYFTMTDYEVLERAFRDNAMMAERGITLDVIKQKGSVFNVRESFYDGLWVHDFAFTTPSGKLEIYQEKPTPRLDYGQEIDKSLCRLPILSHPIEAYEGTEIRKKYPIVLYQEHSKWRVHTFYGHCPWLRELDPEPVVKMSPADAEARSIEHGDIVRVFNDRGSMTVKAFIDPGLPEGMCNCPKGWQRDQFIDGCYQELTSWRLNPISVNQSYADVVVEIQKIG